MIVEKAAPYQPPAGATTPRDGAVWHLVQHHARHAARQMAVDHALAESVWCGRRPPTLRLYRWTKPGTTIGRHQRLDDFQTDEAIRRLTGGRAIHHRDELTFSLALPSGHHLISPTIRATYHTIAHPIHDALIELGLEVTTPESPARDANADRFACFDSPSYGEAMLGPNKLMGLAQWIGPQGLLAQGSLPLEAPIAGQKGLRDLLPGLTWQTLAAAITGTIAKRFGVHFTSSGLTRSESQRATVLTRDHYHPEHGPTLSHQR